MKNNCVFLRFTILISVSIFYSEIIHGQFAYINPLPGSKYHNPQTTLAIRNGAIMSESSIHNKTWIEITGSTSGAHHWTARLSDDKKTVVIKPQPIFDYGETVYVTVHSKLKNENGKLIEGKSFSFQIRDKITPEQQEEFKKADCEFYWEEFGYDPSQQSGLRDNLDSLPTYTISINNNAAPGEIFYNNQYDFNPNDTNCFATIIENDGSLVWAKNLTVNGHDFKINFNGYLTYFTYGQEYWIIMDSNYDAIDSLQAGNGYGEETNPHDCSMYPDGHTFLLIEDKQLMDMSQYGGPTNAIVIGAIVQELDANRDVVFEWSGWDHFQLTDADSHIHLNGGLVDYVHANAITRDNDGNVLLSCRNMSELTKINHSTGDIIWRLGGENNQFTFVNDNIPQHFSYQHDARRSANGNITLFNNGNYLPVRSSAKEYQLDEVNKVATLVWYYEHPDVSGSPVYGPATGSVQRLPNGNTMIDWGTTITQPARPSMTEVDYNKNITWEMKFDKYGEKSYRVHKYVWNPCALVNATHVKVKKIMATSVKVDWEPVKDASSYDLQYRKLGNTAWKLKNTSNTYKKLTSLIANKSYEYQLRTHCANGYVSDWTPSDTFTTAPVRYLSPDVTEAIKLEIYPNPASNLLNVQVDCNNDQPTTISIYDVAGKLIFTSTQIISGGEEVLEINIFELPSGCYFVQVNMSTANKTMKFVKE